MLKLGAHYEREEVHNIFSPHTEFKPQRGQWGIHGAISVPNRKGDYVFFVTFGQKQADHEFDEYITEQGVLSWQSQPSQTLDERRILEWIAHDPNINNIHLFLRTKSKTPYQYLGRLGYLTHDTTREKPVYFQWELLDWDLLDKQLEIDLDLSPIEVEAESVKKLFSLSKTSPPDSSEEAQSKAPSFTKRLKPNYAERDKTNRKLGLAGEKLVLKHLIDELNTSNNSALSKAIIHTSEIEGDGAGFDIQSFDHNGNVKFIEVKTTRSSNPKTPFFISSNELKFAELHASQYELIRVYNYDEKTETGKFYSLSYEDLSKLVLQPQSYKVVV